MSTNVPSTMSIAPVKRYNPGLVVLHWLIAALIFVAAFLAMGQEGGGRGQGAASFAGIPILGVHMLLGITVLVLLLIRLLMRWRLRRPEWATTGSAFLDRVGQWTHVGLYLLVFAVTITGLVLALQTNRLSRIFSVAGSTPGQFRPGQFQPGQLPPSEGFQPGQERPGGTEGGFARGGRFLLGAFHGLSWILLLLLVLLHIGAAFYHQFFRKDNLLGRMWFGGST